MNTLNSAMLFATSTSRRSGRRGFWAKIPAKIRRWVAGHSRIPSTAVILIRTLAADAVADETARLMGEAQAPASVIPWRA